MKLLDFGMEIRLGMPIKITFITLFQWVFILFMGDCWFEYTTLQFFNKYERECRIQKMS